LFSLDWKLAFCSSSFTFLNKYPNIFLIYRTILFFVVLIDLIHGILLTHPIHEWPIYYTHITLLITFFAILFQFIITYRVNFFRGNDIVPRHSLQYIHVILILISLTSGLAVCLLYWTVIYNSSAQIYYPKIILDHGILWLLLFIDIFFLTRLPIYMIDCIPFLILTFIYGLFTLLIFIFKSRFSRNRIGYVYSAFNLSNSPLRVTIQLGSFIVLVPIASVFLLWNIFRLRRAIDVQLPEGGSGGGGEQEDEIEEKDQTDASIIA